MLPTVIRGVVPNLVAIPAMLGCRSHSPHAMLASELHHYQRMRAASGATQSISCDLEATDTKYMEIALQQAALAAERGEVPVGALLVSSDGTVLASAHNQVEAGRDPTAHAEMLCIRAASTQQTGWRLLDCTLYVTLEPCPMCAGALLQARVGTVVYGARNSLLGADGSWIAMLPRQLISANDPGVISSSDSEGEPRELRHPFHPRMAVRRGVLEERCGAVMKAFFKHRRLQSDAT